MQKIEVINEESEKCEARAKSFKSQQSNPNSEDLFD